MEILSADDKSSLIVTQRAWLKYRDGHCSRLYGGSDLGREAAGEKIGCLTKITGARLSELVSLRAGYIVDGFDRAVDIVRYKPVWISYSAALEYLSGLPDADVAWEVYAQANCKMVSTLVCKIQNYAWRG